MLNLCRVFGHNSSWAIWLGLAAFIVFPFTLPREDVIFISLSTLCALAVAWTLNNIGGTCRRCREAM